jgi:hypothetical protein
VIRSVWSPDGRHLAARTQERPFIVTLDDSLKVVSREDLPPYPDPGAYLDVWSWSPDGKWIAGQALQNKSAELKGLALYSVDQKRYELLHESGTVPAWLSDSRRLVFWNNDRIELIDLLTKTVSPVLSLPVPQAITSLGQLPKRNDQIYFTLQPREADVWLIMPEAVRKANSP